MAENNEALCCMAFNIFGIACIVYCSSSLYNLSTNFYKLGQEDQSECEPYALWKGAILGHIIFFFTCMSFSMGTAETFLQNNDRRNPDQHIYRLRFERMVENGIDVIRIFGLLFCGPFFLVECIFTIVFYSRISTGC
jgi:hypothetical protein